MRLSAAGQRMLRLAERILPEIEALEEEFRALRSGKTGRLHIAIECHACFDWLFPGAGKVPPCLARCGCGHPRRACL
jgi:LysR family transcriptional regulator, regulator for metE and metH